MTTYKVPWLERRTNTSGHCLTHDGQERDGGYIETLCGLCITLPTSIEVYDGYVEGLCLECVKNWRSTMCKIIITPDSDGEFDANIPALKGCIAHGETPQEALECVLDAQAAWLEAAEEYEWEVPEVENEK